MSKSKKYYVVWQGHETGIFDSWASCQLSIKGYPNAKYKSFKTRQAAEEAFHGSSYEKEISTGSKKSNTQSKTYEEIGILTDSISVDAACSGNPGIMEYQGVTTYDGSPLFHQGPFEHGTNNVGEFLALVHALAMLKRAEKPNTTIYSDSRIAIGWVRKGKANTKLQKNYKNQKLFELIYRAEAWLKSNTIANPIVKWNTKEWGEIPADFGRK